MQKIISIVIPVYNEEKNIPLITEKVSFVVSKTPYDYEIILVNDGSEDNSQLVIDSLVQKDIHIKSIELSKNFGKESATSAGINNTIGNAVILIDADMQHPPELITKLLQKWEEGADVVVGLRTENKGQPLLKRFCSFIYYKFINVISDTQIIAGATDFRLIDRKVVDEFNKFTEHERITRGLIDWLGFKREFVEFEAHERVNGVASYSYFKLMKLALSSSISHSLVPLKVAGYLGIFITTISGIGGLLIFIQRYVFEDVLNWNISGTGQLAVLMIFFIGVILSCLGLVALYIGNIHHEVSGRPLYIVRSIVNLKKK